VLLTLHAGIAVRVGMTESHVPTHYAVWTVPEHTSPLTKCRLPRRTKYSGTCGQGQCSLFGCSREVPWKQTHDWNPVRCIRSSAPARCWCHTADNSFAESKQNISTAPNNSIHSARRLHSD
jgi:hypothetical protein